LLEVASLVAQATDGNDTNVVIAALLHDAITTDILADMIGTTRSRVSFS
jgi:predicted HD phosphohydrolase